MSLGRLATWCHHHRWRVLGAWVLAVVAVTALGRAAGGTYVDSFSMPNVESKQAFKVLQSRFPARAGDSAEIVFRAPVGVAESEVRARMERLFAEVGRLPHVVEVSSPYAASGRAFSRDGTIGLATVQFDERSRTLPQAAAERFRRDRRGCPGAAVSRWRPAAASPRQAAPAPSRRATRSGSSPRS